MNPDEYPDFFLIDTPSGSPLTPLVVSEACRTLRENCRRYLRERTTGSLVRTLALVAEKWLDEAYPFRRLALESAERNSGFSREVLRQGLDRFFGRITTASLESLLRQDLGHLRRLDGPCADASPESGERRSLASGPELIAHVGAGRIPGPVITSLMLGFLVRSAQFVKCATGTSWLPRLFAHSIYETDRKLGACLEIAEWRGGEGSLETPLFSSIDCLVAMGTDETIGELRTRIPGGVRFLPYGHRVSFLFVSRRGLEASGLRPLARLIAHDVVAWNQSGCLSPHAAYVEGGGTPAPDRLAEAVAAELAALEEELPRGPLEKAEAARIANIRRLYALRQAGSPDIFLLCSRDSTAWTVTFDHEPRFRTSPLNRFLQVKAVESLEEALGGAAEVQGRVSTVGLVAEADEAPALVSRLSRWGVTRVCPAGRMQDPPLCWRHDGRPALADLVTWTDWES